MGVEAGGVEAGEGGGAGGSDGEFAGWGGAGEEAGAFGLPGGEGAEVFSVVGLALGLFGAVEVGLDFAEGGERVFEGGIGLIEFGEPGLEAVEVEVGEIGGVGGGMGERALGGLEVAGDGGDLGAPGGGEFAPDLGLEGREALFDGGVGTGQVGGLHDHTGAGENTVEGVVIGGGDGV